MINSGLQENTLDTSDRLAIYELLALYGHIIDERQWSRIPELFTEDGVFDQSELTGMLGRGMPIARGVAAIRAQWARDDCPHPLAHHGSNIVITETPEGIVHVLSKAMGVGYKGRVGSATYRDVVCKTHAGWRIAHRKVVLRLPNTEPAEPVHQE